MITKNCEACDKIITSRPSVKRRFCSLFCKNRGKNNPMYGKLNPNASKGLSQLVGDKNPNWKGEGVGLTALHSWIVFRKGKPSVCIDCGVTSKEKMLHWSNVDHKYTRELDDYQARCPACHKKYDRTFLGQTNKRKTIF